MPRTKVVKKRRVTQDSIDTCNETLDISQDKKKDLNQKILELEGSIDSAKNLMRMRHGRLIQRIKQFYSGARLYLNDAGLGHMTLAEIRNIGSENKENRIINDIQSLSIKEPGSFVKPKSVQRSLRKRSNSCSSRSTSKKPHIIRSSSCERSNRNIYDSGNKFKTPINRNITSIPVVTPKVNPSVPLSILRRPRQGEFAMSMSGSPLMVSSVTYDDTVSISIPLSDGRVLSILPTEGIDATNLSLDEETREQLKKLRSNLTKCLQK